MSAPTSADGQWDPVELEEMLGPVDEAANAEAGRASLLREAERALWSTDQDGSAHQALVAYLGRLRRARGASSIRNADSALGPVMEELATWPAPERDPAGAHPEEFLDPDHADEPLGRLERRSLRDLAVHFALAALVLGPETSLGRGLARAAGAARGAVSSGDAVNAIRWIEVSADAEEHA